MTSPACIAPACEQPPGVGAVFCERHLQAASGQRGGWLSAYRRRLRLAKESTVPIDASNIAPNLWIGGEPPIDRDLPDVDILVLCAREFQPPRVAFHGQTWRIPIVDDYLEQWSLNRTLMMATDVAGALLQRKRVLVTCSQGRNRSALVAGFALGRVTGMTADQIIALIRQRRAVAGVLSNPAFVGYLQKYVPGRPAGRPRRR